MVWGGRWEEGSGWGTHIYLWRIHFDIWQNQYNIVKLKNKIKLKKKKKKSKETGPISIPGLHLLKTFDVLPQRVRADVGLRVWMHTETTQQWARPRTPDARACQVSVTWAGASELTSKVADALSPKTWWCHAVRTWGLASWAQRLNYCVTLGKWFLHLGLHFLFGRDFWSLLHLQTVILGSYISSYIRAAKILLALLREAVSSQSRNL